ncbi:diacylglycerol kinase family protein [uncultured Schumannella sp.]|uniref:diacylglycerol/lipid kinase family protein n=1 Tax=uncultured Schumannella sp. TaxID=1195956 RepID=UPI0025F93275|nr:diacylglycerol kinase family protein [uncultured Schumannella sp.]
MTAPTPGPHPRAAIIVNPAKANLSRLRSAVARAEVNGGWAESLWLETTTDDIGHAQTREALDAGVDVIVAAGGDGTVRAVAETMSGSGVAFAIIPSGTGNLFARNIDLNSLSVEEAVRVAFTGVDRPIDLGMLELERPDGERKKHGFLVMAGLGIDAQMVANTNPELKKRVGWLAYVDAIARSLRDPRRIRLRAQLDDRPPRATIVHSLLIGNCGMLPGHITLLPDAEIDDGRFDVVTLRPHGFFGWVRVWVALVWENGVLRRSTVGRKLISRDRRVRVLRYLQGENLKVRLERPDLMEIDGDSIGEVIAFRAWVQPGALLLRLADD